MNYTELYKIINQPWVSVKEIRKIARCSRDTAINIRNCIEEKIIKSGKTLPNNKTKYVPTKYVLEYLDLDVNYIEQRAMRDKNMLL